MSNLYRISELIRKAEQSDEGSPERKRVFDELECLTNQLKEATGHEGSRENQHLLQGKVHPA